MLFFSCFCFGDLRARLPDRVDGEFLEQANWYDAWGYHWDYYSKIFLFAKENGLPVCGLNTPREIIAAVRKKRASKR